MTTQPEIKKFVLRLPADLHARLVAEAAADHRSMNSEILAILEDVLAPLDEGRA